jgi:transglutaminase-like putative cysteine protease
VSVAQLGFRPRSLPPATLAARAPAALDPVVARALAVLPLAVYGALRWGQLVEPAGGARLFAGLAAGFVLALAVPRLPRLRLVGAIAGAVVAVGIVLVAAGVRSRLLQPGSLGGLWTGLTQGIGNLPGTTVPYNGADPWARTVILLGGELLVGAGVWAGIEAPVKLSRRTLAALPLVVLVAVPMVVIPAGAPVLHGLVVFALLAAFLWLERLTRRELRGAAWLAAAAALLGALAAPLLDRPKPWVDYEALVQSLASAHVEKFDWSQRYGPIDWPRSSSEVLRIQAPAKTYVKAENLDGFDGMRWFRTTDVVDHARDQVPVVEPQRWLERVRVTVRSMSSSDVLSAGTTLAVDRLDKSYAPAGSPGTYVTEDKLVRGDSYEVESYYPRPAAATLRRAGTSYPGWAALYLGISLPEHRGSRWIAGPRTAQFGYWGEDVAPAITVTTEGPAPVERSDGPLRAGPYAAVWALSQRLAASSATAYDYTRAVLGYLGRGFTYDEDPPARAVPLATFLTTDKRGYCQQFAGAMALLLRMGGVPARVVTGFSPGQYDRDRGEWVVRDYDAHAWVEAWFPGSGWVTFDPTPPVAPALSGAKILREVRGRTVIGGVDIPRRPGAGTSAHAGSGGGAGLLALWLALASVAALASVVLVVRRRHRPVPSDPLLAELERALRLTGRPPQPPLTLAQLERRLRTSPAAAAYVGALRAARFGFGAAATTGAQRRALREELARGLGVGGRLRAFWALPPRLRVR